MTWTLDEIRLIVQEESDTFAQQIARLQPLASGTVHHIFGWDSDIKRLSAKIVGFPDRATLIGYDRDGETHTLSGYSIWWGDYYIHSIQTRLEPSNYQTFYIDENHACDDPVFTVEIELYKSE